MFLLSDRLIRFYKDSKQLRIENFEDQNLHNSFYYFRLGLPVKWPDGDDVPQYREMQEDDSLVLESNKPYRVASLERFTLDRNLFATISRQTRLTVEENIELRHGGSIDPGFSGHLLLSLVNLNSKPRELQVGEAIGKLHFFDISDTGLEEIKGDRHAVARAERLDRAYEQR